MGGIYCKNNCFIMKIMILAIWIVVLEAVISNKGVIVVNGERVLNAMRLRMFVDELPQVPKVYGYQLVDGKPAPESLVIGMFYKKWKFHRDLPETPVFAFGTSRNKASIPGPTIEAVHGVNTYITWQNHLPDNHILPWDPTIPTAVPPNRKGVPTVVHLHGGIDEPGSDGHSHAWFTRGFKEKGPYWSKSTYRYHNRQHPGNLWYHDHAMGLTRVNLLAGLTGAYLIRHPEVEAPLGLPSGDEFDLTLVICDKGFYKNGSIFVNRTGNNPEIHPEWQPEYFGDVIIVNGKAWPYMVVQRRKYRFRIINTSNARFFRFYLTNGLSFIHIASDSAYIDRPTTKRRTLLAPSEIVDVVIDFSISKTSLAILANDAAYPFPSGDPVNDANSKVMKFIIKDEQVPDPSRIPHRLIKYPSPDLSSASRTRYIAMYEYTSAIDEPTHLYINGLSFDNPATETPKVGTSEVWYVINLTDDNHPLHIHLGLFVVLEQSQLLDLDAFKDCMGKMNDAEKCHVEEHARGKKLLVPRHERGWKNVFKMRPGYMTKIYVRFAYIHDNVSYPFDATAEPGYVYHCHDRTSTMPIGVGEQQDGLYYFRGVPHVVAMKANSGVSLELWHKRMGHPSLQVTKLLPGVSSRDNNSRLNKHCDVCQREKQSRDKFPVSDHRASEIFELVHCDLWDPYRTKASCGASYFWTIVNDFSHSVWIYLLIDKTEVSHTMHMFFSIVERQFSKNVKIVRSDNGTKFTCMTQYFLDHGIIFQTSCVGTLQQNGRVERKHQHILNVGRALRFQGNLPIDFWGECVLIAGYLINRTPSSVLHGKTSYSVLYGKESTYDHLPILGCCACENGGQFKSRSR